MIRLAMTVGIATDAAWTTGYLKHPGGDSGKCDGVQSQIIGHTHRFAITPGKDSGFTAGSAFPNGADGMNDILGRKLPGCGGDSASWRQRTLGAANAAALAENLRAAFVVNRAAEAASG